MQALLRMLPPRMVEGLVKNLLAELEGMDPGDAAVRGGEMGRAALETLSPAVRANLVAFGDTFLSVIDPQPTTTDDASPNKELHERGASES